MITPRLYRRSLAAAAQWRLLLLFWMGLLVPGTIAALPVSRFLAKLLDHSTVAGQHVAWMDGATLIEIARQLGTDGNGAAIGGGLLGGLIALAFFAPLVAGATVAAARSDEPLPFSRLLAGGGELYFRMLRTTLWGAVPVGLGLGVASLLVGAVAKLNEKAIWEATAGRRKLVALVAASLVVFVFHLLVDLTRAQFAADPTRRSALFALWASVRVFLRRPLRILGMGAVGTVAAFVPAAVFMLLRLRVTQSTAMAIGTAWLLAQLAQLSVGWGRNARLFGLAELVRADALDRPVAQAFTMEPPASNPPAVESALLPALSAPGSPDLSTPDRSAT